MKVKVICILKDPSFFIMENFTIGRTYDILFTQDKTPSYPQDGFDPNKGSYIIIDDEDMPCMISEDNMWKNFTTIRESSLNKLGI